MVSFDTMMVLAILNILFAFLAILPMMLNLKYFIQFRIVDYFLLFLYFLEWSVYSFLEATSQYGHPGTFWPDNLWTEPFFYMLI